MGLLCPSKRGKRILTTPRIYVPAPSVILAKAEIHGSVELGKDHLRYVKSVLRMKRGDHLTLFDGTGWEYETVIEQISAEGIVVDVVHKRRTHEETLRVTLMQSL